MLRRGSLTADMAREDPEILKAALADYLDGRRRDHCSRQDFMAGWLAAYRRLKLEREFDIEFGRFDSDGPELLAS